MMLEVTIDTLKKGRITAHQFLIAELLSRSNIVVLKDYLILSNSEESFPADLENLEKAGYISYNKDNPKDFLNIRVHPLFFKEIANGDYFEELFMNFPLKVVRTNGVSDFLRTEKTYCKNIYDARVARNKQKHDHIMRCLKKEIEIREKENSMAYMKRLSNWLASQEWKSFEDRLDESVLAKHEANKYGTDLE